jgi:hypothetical protein
MQRAKLFGALFAYVNNIQITWKTIHLSIFLIGNDFNNKFSELQITIRKKNVVPCPKTKRGEHYLHT